ncbi:hypothetical protein SVAN01_02246 [Stagonosporopsis vannaccii]|nr:hypothetical protein SVAN01_02246 [Stagonosporopsis vannaccii]
MANTGLATSSAEVAVGRRERWVRGQFERNVTKYTGEQERQWPWRASKGFLPQMLCARTPATLLLDLSVAANAAITDTHVALPLHELVWQGSCRGAGKAKLKRSFTLWVAPAASAARAQRSHVSRSTRRPVSGMFLFRLLHLPRLGQVRLQTAACPAVPASTISAVGCSATRPLSCRAAVVPGPMGDNWRAGGFHKRATRVRKGFCRPKKPLSRC